ALQIFYVLCRIPGSVPILDRERVELTQRLYERVGGFRPVCFGVTPFEDAQGCQLVVGQGSAAAFAQSIEDKTAHLLSTGIKVAEVCGSIVVQAQPFQRSTFGQHGLVRRLLGLRFGKRRSVGFLEFMRSWEPAQPDFREARPTEIDADIAVPV